MPKLHFILQVWGRDYIETMITYLLPMLLANKNIPALNEKPFFSLCMKQKEFEAISNYEIIKMLKKFTKFRFIEIDDILEKDNYNLKFHNNLYKMTLAENRAISSLKYKSLYQIFLQADQVFFNGAIKNLEKLIKKNKNKKVFLAYSLHVLKENFSNLIKSFYKDNIIDISSKDLNKIILNNLHYMSLNSEFSSKNFFPTGNIFFKNKESLIAIMSILHPIAVFSDKLIPEDGTFDNSNYLKSVINDKNEIYVIEDTSILHACSLDNKEQKKIFSKPYGAELNYISSALFIIKERDNFFHNFLKYTGIFETDEKGQYNKNLIRLANNVRNKLIWWIEFFKNNPEIIFDWKDLQINFYKGKIEEINNFIKNFLNVLYKKSHDEIVKNFLHKSFFSIEEIAKVLNVIGEGKGFIPFDKGKYKIPSERLKNLIKNFKGNIAIYGAGEDTFILSQILNFNKNEILVIFDDSPNKIGKKINNINIDKFEKCFNIIQCKIKAIAVISSQYGREISEKLSYLSELGIEIKEIM